MSGSTPPLHRCSTCQSTGENARNLAVFIDGTSNKPGVEQSNVVKLHNLVSDAGAPELDQCKYYLEGIGVHDHDHDFDSPPLGPGARIHSLFEMAFAWNVEKNVKKAYSWLAKTYRRGDQIYLFGFSRGAYQVWTLASMIHEMGLLKEMNQTQLEQVYHIYSSINPNDPGTRQAALQFKKDFCLCGVRIHFVGVWDTVSSLGLIKKVPLLNLPPTISNACHFRHALALDERRVKFLPEYVIGMKPRPSNAETGKLPVSDVKEVWFAGCHSDVGGIDRPHTARSIGGDSEAVHAGNVPLQWMVQEAAAHGLSFKLEQLAWCPEDVYFGRQDSMNAVWRLLEYFPVFHQVSFEGTGKHERRLHLSCPRKIVPGQQIHSSVLSQGGSVYTPRATLGDRIDISAVPREDLDKLWTCDFPECEATAHLLTALLSDRCKALTSLKRVLFLLDSWLSNGQNSSIPTPQWLETSILETSIHEQPSSNKLTLTVIYDVISNSCTPEDLVKGARDSLSFLLYFPDHLDFSGTLCVLRLSAKHEKLRRQFIAHEVITALVLALEWASKSCNEELFPLVMDSLRYLIGDNDKRDYVIKELRVTVASESHGSKKGETRLLLALKVKGDVPSHLVASLKMIKSLAPYQRVHCEGVMHELNKLARNGRNHVGVAAVEALVALNEPLPRDVHFSNIMSYLGNILPPLDAEDPGNLPAVLLNGSGDLDEALMRKLVRTIELRKTHECSAATLILLKLCNYSIVRDFCSCNKVLEIFMKQMEQKETSLLAAHALSTCLRHNMWLSDDFPRAARLTFAMFNKGWFNGTIYWMEGIEIFDRLMTSDNLRRRAIDLGMMATLVKMMERGECNEVRTSLRCLEILGSDVAEELTRTVTECLKSLRGKRISDQKRSAKLLSCLSQTKRGEQEIRPRVTEIVKMLLPPSDGTHQFLGPAAALSGLCKNETLRLQILGSQEWAEFRRLRSNPTLYPRV